jgi:fucose 4-O-acetylase-like acetyltransferase
MQDVEIEKQTRITCIDGAKGIAMFMVMVSHLANLPYALTASYVALFFFASGYTFHKKRPPLEVISKRAKQLLIPYVCGEAVCLAGQIASDVHGSGRVNIDMMIKALIGIATGRVSLYALNADVPENVYFWIWGIGPLWFLLAFFSTSILFYPLMKYVAKGRKQCIITCTMLVLLAVPCSYIKLSIPWYLDAVFSNTLLMIAGWLTAQLLTAKWYEQWNARRMLWMLIVGALYVGMCRLNPGVAMSISAYGEKGVFVFWGIAITGSLLYIATARILECVIPPCGKIAALLGRHTIGLFCSHMIFYKLFGKLDAILGATEYMDKHLLFSALLKASCASICWLVIWYTVQTLHIKLKNQRTKSIKV